MFRKNIRLEIKRADYLIPQINKVSPYEYFYSRIHHHGKATKNEYDVLFDVCWTAHHCDN